MAARNDSLVIPDGTFSMGRRFYRRQRHVHIREQIYTFSQYGGNGAAAIEAGIADRVWGIDDLAALLEEKELASIEAGEFKRGKYRTKDRSTL